MWKAEIIADSVGSHGSRLTTFELCYPAIIHAQVLTHRAFSRNASSSRAIPLSKMIAEVEQHGYVPEVWGANQKGMVAGDAPVDVSGANDCWRFARNQAVFHAKVLSAYGVHKQWVNRLLTPFMWMKVVLSSTDYGNFFALRCEHDAQPEMQKLANMMKREYTSHAPVECSEGALHLPYVTLDEQGNYPVEYCKFASSARCARVSYDRHGGGSDLLADVERGKKLMADGHWSPLEHQATCQEKSRRSANYVGWRQFRKELGG